MVLGEAYTNILSMSFLIGLERLLFHPKNARISTPEKLLRKPTTSTVFCLTAKNFYNLQ